MAERAFNLLTSTIGECMRICEQRKMNAAVLDELKLLLKTLQDTNDLLQRKIKEGSHHRNIHSSALDALRIDLESVMEDANTIKNLGLLKSYWNASETQAKLQSLRERVVISFQTKILFATLDVLEGLRCVTLEQCSEGESSGSGSKERAQSSDLYKWYEDPILLETMSDPVKASDGITYDRWTLLARSPLMLENNGPLLILVDDIDVQKRLFDEFPEQLEVYKSKRAAFKEAALQAAHTGHLGDALVMLNHVLKWAPHDASCRIERDRVQRAVLQDCCAITTGAAGSCCINEDLGKSTTRADDDFYIADHEENDISSPRKLHWKLRQVGGNPNLVCISDDPIAVFKSQKDVDLGIPGIQLLYADVPHIEKQTFEFTDGYFFQSMITMEAGGSGVADLAVGFSTKEMDTISNNTSLCAHDPVPLLGTFPGSCGYYPMQGIVLYYDREKSQTVSVSCKRCRVGDFVGAGFNKSTQTLFFAHCTGTASGLAEVVMSVDAVNVFDYIQDQVFYAVALQGYGVGVQGTYSTSDFNVERPKHLDRTSCNQSMLRLLPDGLSVLNVSNHKGRRPMFGFIRADVPVSIQQRYFYFEVKIEKGEEMSEFAAVALGFTGTDTFCKNGMPGWSNSCAYNGSDGQILQNEQQGIAFGPAVIEGDDLGAGINFASNEIFFVLNGVLIGAVQNCVRGRVLTPFVGLGHPNIRIRANFGDDFGGRKKVVNAGCSKWRLVNNPHALTLVELGEDGRSALYKVGGVADGITPRKKLECGPAACLRANRNVFSEGLLYRAIARDASWSTFSFVEDMAEIRFCFEVTVMKQSRGDNIAIGFCEQNHFREDMMPGCYPHSIAYHTRTGELFMGSSKGRKFAPASSQGDTIWAGFSLTYNGIVLSGSEGAWYKLVRLKRKRRLSCAIYPVIGFQGAADMEVKLHFINSTYTGDD